MTKAKERAEAVIAAWQEAYRKANGKEAPEAEYRSGWVMVRSLITDRYRVSDLENNTARLRQRAAVADMDLSQEEKRRLLAMSPEEFQRFCKEWNKIFIPEMFAEPELS